MSPDAPPGTDVLQAVPFLMVTDMERALAFYCDGLGFQRRDAWTPRGRIEWCWLELGQAALMLQEYRPGSAPAVPRGEGVRVCFLCRDALALYRAAKARGLAPQRPFVGNRLWVTSLTDPDGYRLDFESPTDAPEDTLHNGD